MYQIELKPERNALFDEMGLRRLRDSYMLPEENCPQERFAAIAREFASNEAHAQRLYDYSSRHWLSNSSPMLSYSRKRRGLPISCYLSYIPDTAKGLVDSLSEISWLSMLGGGVGIGMGMRAEDSKSVGVMPHSKVYEAISLAYRQGETRRGSFATYLDVSHPNVMQFIDMRKPTGDEKQRCMELHHGLNITDDFMEIIEESEYDANYDDSWELRDPHSNKVREIVSARHIWEQLLLTRARTGEPMIHFIDTSNAGLPDFQKALGLSVKQSNICTEITLATDEMRTAVCCLASLNLVYWDEWKDNYQFYRDVAEMLDNALTIFINEAPDEIERAKYSAMRERAIGIGALGFHALLQKRMLPYESAPAIGLNHAIFSRYRKYLDRANLELGAERGECPDAKGTGRRFSHTVAIAPNATSSMIMGNTSPSTEPFRSNGYRQDTLSGLHFNRNQYLDALLLDRLESQEEYDEVWSSIVTNRGSVQHLDCLTQYEKDVFKTFAEIDQEWVIEHAVARQPYIDQAQSVNIAIFPDCETRKLHDIHMRAWKGGLKTLYYCRSEKPYTGEALYTRNSRIEINQPKEEGCLACE